MSHSASELGQPIEDGLPGYRTEGVYCVFCSYDWVGAFPYDLKLFRCPSCNRIIPVTPIVRA